MTDQTIPGMAEAIAARMAAEGLSPSALEVRSGLSNPMCIEVRSGKRKQYAFKTRAGFAKALRWPGDWYERMVAGEDPARFPTVDWPTSRSIEDRMAALEERVEALTELVLRDEQR